MKFFSIRWLFIAASSARASPAWFPRTSAAATASSTDGGGGGSGGGGGTGGGGGAVAPRFSNTFDTDKQSWTLSDYVDANYFNLGRHDATGLRRQPGRRRRADARMVGHRRRSDPGLAQGDGDVHRLQAVHRSADQPPDAPGLQRHAQHREARASVWCRARSRPAASSSTCPAAPRRPTPTSTSRRRSSTRPA